MRCTPAEKEGALPSHREGGATRARWTKGTRGPPSASEDNVTTAWHCKVGGGGTGELARIDIDDEEERGRGGARSEHDDVGQSPCQDALEDRPEDDARARLVGGAGDVRVQRPLGRRPVQVLEELREERLGRRDVAVGPGERREERRERRVARQDLLGEAVALVEEEDEG